MNLPNKLSILRIIMVPFFIACYFVPYSVFQIVALAIFILAAFTDFLDGYIARKHNLVTDLGKLLDPIADKILVCSALFCITVRSPARYLGVDMMGGFAENQLFALIICISGIIIISRELLISAVRQIAAAKGVVVKANVFGKVKTILQDVAIPFLVFLQALAINMDSWEHISVRTIEMERDQMVYNVVGWIGISIFGLAVVATILSGVVYLVQNKKVFLENDD